MSTHNICFCVRKYLSGYILSHMELCVPVWMDILGNQGPCCPHTQYKLPFLITWSINNSFDATCQL